MSVVNQALNCSPQGDYISKKRVKVFSDHLNKGEKAHYYLAATKALINNETKNPSRLIRTLITDQGIYLQIRSLTGENKLVEIPIAQIEEIRFDTGITSKKVNITSDKGHITLKVTKPGKSECKEASEFVKKIINGANPSSEIEPNKDGLLMEAKGSNGQIQLFENKVVLTRKGVKNKLIHGFKGSKEIPIEEITGVQYKEPGKMTAGYLQFGQSGYSESTGGLQDAVKDENTITFGNNPHKFEIIKQKIEEIRSSDQTNSSESSIKRLKERFAEGEITKEEYQEKLDILQENS